MNPFIKTSDDVVTLAEALIACPSVTPAAGLVFDCLEKSLTLAGFAVHRFMAGELPDGPVENLFAIRHGPLGSSHFAFAGHVDVVPPGEGWSHAPFAPTRVGIGDDALLLGRGAVDMKGAIAAMIVAAQTLPDEAGTLSFIITGDEEGPARFGTRALIDYLRASDQIPDFCLVGEPTSVHRLGDMLKIGRRGSVNIWLTVAGREGHVAYPHLSDNPCTKLVALLADLKGLTLDTGSEWFQPSNLEVTDIAVGNPAHNVIPASAQARISIRFNDHHSGQSLANLVSDIAARHGASAHAVISGEAFRTPPGRFSRCVAEAILAETGITPDISTSGGTSDARFLKDLCPVIEFGLPNATMHKRDEAVALSDLKTLANIYRLIAATALAEPAG